MTATPLDTTIVTETIHEMGLGDFSGATIRDIAMLAGRLESRTGQPVIHLEMGVPGLPSPKVGIEAEKKALDEGCAAVYPPNAGIARLKNAASQFVKAFIGIDVNPQGCIATVGSMQGTFAVFTTLHLALPQRPKVLFIHPGFPVQTDQCRVIGLTPVGIDIHDLRGSRLLEALEKEMAAGDVAGLVYSNPNNPSWVCLTEAELQGIGALATKYDVVVLEDLAYFAMDFRRDLSHPFEAPYQATVARYTDNVIMTISGSKAFSYAGQRIGVCCIANGLYSRKFEALQATFGVPEFGRFLDARIIYTLSSGCCHSAQHGMAAMMEAACQGTLDFVSDVREYGRRAAFMKKVLLDNGFYLVYDNDQGEPLADGFYFTVQYPGMTDLALTRELMYYGVAVYPLDTMGSHEQGVRICTSFFKPEQQPIFAARIQAFRSNHPLA